MKRDLIFFFSVVVVIGVLMVVGMPVYLMHVLVEILIWGAIYSGWTLLGRFGIVSLGHGGFVGIGAYGVVLLWNHLGVSPWIGIVLSTAATMLVAFVVGYPCFRLRVVGHNFALVTLALSVVVQLAIIAARDVTGGSLGMTPKEAATPLLALQFANKQIALVFALAFWLATLWIWRRIDSSMTKLSLAASAEQEEAAAAIGINVAFEKLKVLLLSAAITSIGGSLFAQYLMYVDPDTFSGPSVSLQLLYASVVGGMYTSLGPTVGSALTTSLTEFLRILFGTKFIGAANTIYGLMLIIFVIFMPQGIWGMIVGRLGGKRAAATRARAELSGNPPAAVSGSGGGTARPE